MVVEIMSQFDPRKYRYDYNLGQDISGKHIEYIKENHVIQSRISSTRCYLLRPRSYGESVGTDGLLTLNNFIETSPRYIAQAWPSGSLAKPSTDPEQNQKEGAIMVFIDGVEATRVLDVNDLLDNDEYAVVERRDLADNRVEIVFNAGFNAAAHVITWQYSTMNEGVTNEMLKRGESDKQSLFGWYQYTNNCYDDYQGRHQILVRMPLVIRDLIINEEGKVTLDEKESWMIWTPYVRDFDILVISPVDSPTGEEMRFEIVNKRDSVIQRNLVSQRFKIKYIESTDARYSIPVYTSDTTVDPLVTSQNDTLWAPITNEGTTLWRYIASDLIYDSDYETYISVEH